jgi:hypothetical protein
VNAVYVRRVFAVTSSVTSVGRAPTEDERLGMAWWNGLTEVARIFWLEQASVGGRLWDVSAADAWATYKESNAP